MAAALRAAWLERRDRRSDAQPLAADSARSKGWEALDRDCVCDRVSGSIVAPNAPAMGRSALRAVLFMKRGSWTERRISSSCPAGPSAEISRGTALDILMAWTRNDAGLVSGKWRRSMALCPTRIRSSLSLALVGAAWLSGCGGRIHAGGTVRVEAHGSPIRSKPPFPW